MKNNEELRWGVLGFLSTILLFSVALNAFLIWKLYNPVITGYLVQFRKPGPVTAADHVRGDSSSQVTLIEYADFQCPYCQMLHGVLKELVKQEKVRWVFREYPLPMHNYAERYAEACECAGEQGKFWEYADALYGTSPPKGSIEDLTAASEAIGLSSTAFQNCLTSRSEEKKVRRDKSEGDSLLISGTPTFFINGKRHVGMMPLNQILKLMEESGKKE